MEALTVQDGRGRRCDGGTRHEPQTAALCGAHSTRHFQRGLRPFHAQARGLLPKMTAVNSDDSGVPAAVVIRRRTVRMAE